jgi:hypothetical protein
MAGNIPQYVSPAGDVPQPTDLAANTAREAGMVQNRFAREGGESIGAGIGAVGGAIQLRVNDWQNHVDQQQIGHGAAVSTRLYANLMDSLNTSMANADPNDQSVGQGFREKNLEPALENFQNQFQDGSERVREWALSTADGMRRELSMHISAQDSIRAQAALEQNTQVEMGYLAKTVNEVPSGLPYAIQKLQLDASTFIDAHSDNLGAGGVAKANASVSRMTGLLTVSALQGMIDKNPQAAQDWYNDPKNESAIAAMTPEHRLALQERLKSAFKAEAADSRQDDRQRRQDIKDVSSDKAEEYRTGMYDPASGRIRPVQPKLNMQIMKDSTLTAADKTQLIHWNQTQYTAQIAEDKQAAAGNATKDDSNLLLEYKNRIGDVDNPLTRQEVIDAVGAERMTVKTGHDMMWRIGQTDAQWNGVQRQFNAQFATIKHAALTSPQGMIDPLGTAQRLNQVELDAQYKLRQAISSHQPTADMFNPKSTNYILSPAATAPIFATPPKATVGAQADQIREGVVVNGFRFPDQEKADAYRKAIGAAPVAGGAASPAPEVKKALMSGDVQPKFTGTEAGGGTPAAPVTAPPVKKTPQAGVDIEAERRSAYESVQAANRRYETALAAGAHAIRSGANPDTLNELDRDVADAKKTYDIANERYKKANRGSK